MTETCEDLIESTRFSLAPMIGPDLRELRRHVADQVQYAVHGRAIAEKVAALIAEQDAGMPAQTRRTRSALLQFLASRGDDPIAGGDSTAGSDAEAASRRYRVYTRAYDRERPVGSLVRSQELVGLRQRLDVAVTHQAVNVARLARDLAALLAQPTREGWDDGQERGVIDGRRLTQLITSPSERRLFRSERDQPRVNCLVTMLVDCSGSMRRHNQSVAVIVDVLAHALELAGASTEVLGFTTGAWNGGRALQDWVRAGRPAQPGRLNEVTHLVCKDADTSWRRARTGIASLLKDDLFREGVDGEAVAWACDRMRALEHERRLLIVLTDGSPMDSATNLANHDRYLDHHLRDIVRREEARGVRIHGIGVGHDLTPYYPRSLALDLERGAVREMLREVVALLASATVPQG